MDSIWTLPNLAVIERLPAYTVTVTVYTAYTALALPVFIIHNELYQEPMKNNLRFFSWAPDCIYTSITFMKN